MRRFLLSTLLLSLFSICSNIIHAAESQAALEMHCRPIYGWCLEVGIKTFLSADPISQVDVETLVSLGFSHKQVNAEWFVQKATPRVAPGIYAVRELDWISDLELRVGLEYVQYESTGLTGNSDPLFEPTGFARTRVAGVSIPVSLQKSFPEMTFGRGRWVPGVSAGFSYTFVTGVSGSFMRTERVDYSHVLDRKNFASLIASALLDWRPSQIPGVITAEISYEKGLGAAYDRNSDTIGSAVTGFQSEPFDMVTLRFRYGF